MANITMTLWGGHLLQKWNTHINIVEVLEMDHINSCFWEVYYKALLKKLVTIEFIRSTTSLLSGVPMVLILKLLSKKHIGLKQLSIVKREIKVLEQLVQEQLDAQHIEGSTILGILLYLLLKRNLENGEWKDI